MITTEDMETLYKDAARYRWLRSRCEKQVSHGDHVAILFNDKWMGGWCEIHTATACDVHVDKAMEERKNDDNSTADNSNA